MGQRHSWSQTQRQILSSQNASAVTPPDRPSIAKVSSLKHIHAFVRIIWLYSGSMNGLPDGCSGSRTRKLSWIQVMPKIEPTKQQPTSCYVTSLRYVKGFATLTSRPVKELRIRQMRYSRPIIWPIWHVLGIPWAIFFALLGMTMITYEKLV